MPADIRPGDRIIPVELYTESARIYDAMMADVDYESWCNYLLDVMEEEELLPESLCDMSCGTGLVLREFRGAIPKLVGCDSSQAMLDVFQRNYPDIPVKLGDMNQLPFEEDFDLYLNVHDALNYLPTQEALEDHLKGMAKRLKPGAAYFFDFALPPLIQGYFADTHESGDADGYHFLRKNLWDAETRECLTQIYITRPGDRHTIYLEKHRQKIYTWGEIEETFSHVQGVRIKAYREFSFEAADETVERILVVMKHD